MIGNVETCLNPCLNMFFKKIWKVGIGTTCDLVGGSLEPVRPNQLLPQGPEDAQLFSRDLDKESRGQE